MRSAAKLAWILGAVLSLGIAGYGLHYLIPGATAPPGPAENPFRLPWLPIHAVLAATALLVGPFQLWPRSRSRWPRLHRWTGRCYVACCMVGGVSGLLLAFGSTAGPVATVGFGSLALVWMIVTAKAWRLAQARRFVEHRRWMIRSFALTFAAVTLRLYLPLIVLTNLDFLSGYRAISFLCWAPNLIAAELYLARRPLARAATAA